MLIAPTEPKTIRELGKVSSLPEKCGCDVLAMVKGKKVGVQRKELKDLLASVADGRLAKEMGQMTAANLGARLLVIEGRAQWTTDGVMIQRWGQTWTKRQYAGLLWSVMETGCWVSTTDGLPDTAELVQWFITWCSKEHRTLATRPGPAKLWGSTATSLEWSMHFLAGLPGVGPRLAHRIISRFDGVPMRWTVTAEELASVEGIGKKKAAAMMRVLEHE